MAETRYQIVCRFEFDAAHRLKDHPGKCRNLHGHRYVAEVACSASAKEDGMVVDFGTVKERVGGWIDSRWDHLVLYELADTRLMAAMALIDQLTFGMPCAPTAENMARYLYEKAKELLPEVSVDYVTIWETPSCRATYPMAVAYVETVA